MIKTKIAVFRGPGQPFDLVGQTLDTLLDSGECLVEISLATICGALGAHALPGRPTPREMEIYDTAVRFQFFQALGLLVQIGRAHV